MKSAATILDEHIEAFIQPLLRQYGVTIWTCNYSGFYDLLIIEYRGEQVALCASVVAGTKPVALRFFLENWDKLQAVLAHLMSISSPFYSDIFMSLDDACGKGHVGERVLAFAYICDRLTKAGKRIWPND